MPRPSNSLTTQLWTASPAAVPSVSLDRLPKAGTQKEIFECSGSPLRLQSVFKAGGRHTTRQISYDTAPVIYNQRHCTGHTDIVKAIADVVTWPLTSTRLAFVTPHNQWLGYDAYK